MSGADWLGTLIVAINLLSMAMEKEFHLRALGILANLLLTIYAVLLGAIPLGVGGILAVCIHSFRIKQTQSKT